MHWAVLIGALIALYPVMKALDWLFGNRWWFLIAFGGILAALCFGLATT